MPIKVAFIGAGSVGFTRTLLRDILTVPEFADTRFAFTDISRRNLDMVRQLCTKDIRENNLPAIITAVCPALVAISKIVGTSGYTGSLSGRSRFHSILCFRGVTPVSMLVWDGSVTADAVVRAHIE